jgi:hypothetical protein
LVGHVTTNAAGIGAELLYGGVEFGLPAAGEKDVSAFGDEALGCA